MEPQRLLPLPVWQFAGYNPEIVRIFDKIRFGPLVERDDLGEFLWFIREYPRVFRHHIGHAEFRLAAIYGQYKTFHSEAAALLAAQRHSGDVSVSRRPGRVGGETYSIYWNFESYLSAISSALDVAARIAGTAFLQETPFSFNRFCKSAPPSEIAAVFQRAQRRWVRRLKAYRDCFVHYTPVDTILLINLRQVPEGWQVRTRIPINPESHEILAFKYSKRVELLSYAIRTWKQLRAFDRDLAKLFMRGYRSGAYPVRTDRLFVLRTRSRP